MSLDNFIHQSPEIYQAYQAGSLYEKDWDPTTGTLKTKEWKSWLVANWNHFWESGEDNEKVNNEVLKSIFDTQVTQVNEANVDFGKFSTSELEGFLRILKVQKSFKGVNYQVINLFNKFISFANESYKKFGNLAILSDKDRCFKIIEFAKEFQISTLLHEIDPKKSPLKLNMNLDNVFEKELFSQVYKAHEAFVSFQNQKSDIEIAEDIIPSFKELENNKNPKLREFATELLNIVTYGEDAAAIVKGEKNPSIFWNFNKVIQKIVWWVQDLFYPGSRADEALTVSAKNKYMDEFFSTEANNEFFSTEASKLSVEARKELSDEARKEWKKLADNARKEIDPYINTLINDRTKMLDGNLLTLYANVLDLEIISTDKDLAKVKLQKDFSYISGYTAHMMGEQIEYPVAVGQRAAFFRDTTAELCFLPYVFEGEYSFYPKHVVLIIFDRVNKQIQYYDPQGLPPGHPDRLTNGDINLQRTLEKMRDEWLALDPDIVEIEIVHNKQIHQTDSTSCGVYVANCIKRIIAGKSFAHVCMHGKDTDAIMEARDEMASELILWKSKQPPTPIEVKATDNKDDF